MDNKKGKKVLTEVDKDVGRVEHGERKAMNMKDLDRVIKRNR